jgi:hypothetical protein
MIGSESLVVMDCWHIHQTHLFKVSRPENKLKKKKPGKGTRKEKRKDRSPNKRPHLKAPESVEGALEGEITKPRT